MENEKFILEVNDEGDGISDEHQYILKTNSKSSFHGYGVTNINKRIKLLYGEEYGLSSRDLQHGSFGHDLNPGFAWKQPKLAS